MNGQLQLTSGTTARSVESWELNPVPPWEDDSWMKAGGDCVLPPDVLCRTPNTLVESHHDDKRRVKIAGPGS